MAKVVTLFIDDNNIRLLISKGKRVQKWSRLLLEPGLVRDGVIIEEDQVAEKLKELFQLENITPTNVIAGISGLNSLYRLITLPELPEAVKAEAIKHEAGRVIPVSLSQVYYSYQLLPSPKGESRFFLAAFPQNATDALIRTLRRVGIEPYLMDLAPLALCRTVNEPRAIIINAGVNNLDIVIMADRVPEVIRSLSPPSEATSLSEALPAIIEELERTIAFYNSGHLDKQLDSTVPILVSGDLAESPESWQSLAGKSNYSVSILPPLMEFPEGFNPHQFMVNIGLALKELQLEKGGANFPIVNFNALPSAYLPKAPQVGRVLIPITIGGFSSRVIPLKPLIYRSNWRLPSPLLPPTNR
jgi:type IV pilus assembly protein PilM